MFYLSMHPAGAKLIAEPWTLVYWTSPERELRSSPGTSLHIGERTFFVEGAIVLLGQIEAMPSFLSSALECSELQALDGLTKRLDLDQ